jgi:signal transduction histidine kinase
MDFFISVALIALLLDLFLVFLVMHRDQKSRLNQVFAHLLLAMGLWALVVFGIRSSTDPGAIVLWMKAMGPLIPLLCALYFHFTMLYAGTPVKKWYLISIYSVCGLFIALAPTDLVISGATQSVYAWAPTWGPLAFLFAIVVAFFVITGLVLMVRTVRKARLKVERVGAGLLIDSSLLCVLGGLAGTAHSLGFALFPIAIFCNMLFGILATAIVLKFHALDRKVIARKIILYSSLVLLTAAIYFIVIFLVRTLFSPSDLYMAFNFAVLIAVAIGLSPAYHGIEEAIDRWFYHERYDKLKALEKFSLQTYQVDDLDQLSTTLVGLISEALQSPDVYLLLTSAKGDLVTVASTRKDTLQYSIKADSPLVAWMKTARMPISRDKIASLPTVPVGRGELIDMNTIGAELFVPVVTKQNELAGLIVLGQKTSIDSYSREDERMAFLVASNTATQLENARLYRLEKTIREEIQQQAAQKTTFLHTIAHELKTPLTAIISSSELLAEEKTAPDAMRDRMVNNIRKSAETLDKRVSELLDLAKVEIGVLQIAAEPVQVNELISEVVSQLTPVFDIRQQHLRPQVPKNLPRVNADRERLKQVVFNLLANSHKFAPPESEVFIRVHNGSDRIVIEVEDAGPQIPEIDRPRLFEPYFRSEDPKRLDKYPGMGLGLSLSKKIVELQQGKIWYDPDKAPSRNIFAFSLPVYTGRDTRKQTE